MYTNLIKIIICRYNKIKIKRKADVTNRDSPSGEHAIQSYSIAILTGILGAYGSYIRIILKLTLILSKYDITTRTVLTWFNNVLYKLKTQ